MRLSRILAGGFVAGIVLSSLGIGLAIPAANAVGIGSTLATGVSVAAGVPGPLNVLPSVVVGAKTAAVSSPEAMMALLLPRIKDGSFVRAADAFARGAATAEQSASVAAEAGSFVVPATKALPLLKLANGANVAMIGLTAGMMAGNGAARLFGFKDDQVCAENNGVLEVISAITNGVSCDAFKNTLAQEARNFDAGATYSGKQVCNTTGRCMSLSGVGSASGTQLLFFTVTGTGWSATSGNSVGYSWICGSIQCGNTSSSAYFKGFGTVLCNNAPAGVLCAPASLKPAEASTLACYSFTGSTSGCTAGSTLPSPAWVDVVKSNPNRAWQCTIDYSDGTSAVQSSDGFTEADPVFKGVKCPTGNPLKVPTRTRISEVQPDVPGSIPSPLLDQPTTPEYQAYRAQFPGCDTGTCFLDLLKGGQSCFAVAGLCADWFASPTKDADYQCQYGGASVALTECNAYAPRFNPDAQLDGKTLADPSTGIVPDAPAQPGTNTVQPGAQPADPEQVRQCDNVGFGMIKCALEAMFIPRASALKARMDAIKAKWGNTQPAKLIVALGGIAPALATLQDGGCGGIPIDLHGIAPNIIPAASGKFLPACPGDFFEPWALGVKIFLVGSLSIGGFFAIKAQVSRLFGLAGTA